MRWFIVLAAFLCWISGVIGAASTPDKFEKYHSLSSTTPIALDDSSYEDVTAKPRDYYVSVLLTATDSRFGCILCREFQPEWELISRSWNKGSKPDDMKMLFATLDFSDGKMTFQKVQAPDTRHLVVVRAN